MAGRIANIPKWLWAPSCAGLLSAVIGATGIWAGLPWLFPSLGPTIYLQVHTPAHKSARVYNVVAGHFIGAAAAAASVLVTGAGAAPPVLSSGVLTWPRLWAAALAMGVTLLFQIPLKAGHPPAAATAMLIALGGFSLTAHDMLVLAAGVILTALFGELLRRLRDTAP